ncbi:UNVERIFIED_CONTAM: hypothetical protein Slati_1065000 [Sesamum latifolium]|uniref:Uncharacterized protein n=1 Tax=Sesamum latifolium TaxID=2727402 RepID=A0AAW2XT28_9LAMI
MGGTAKMNAMRSAVVVVGALAFGYLTLQLGFKPFLEKAQLEQQRQEALLQAQSASSQAEDSFDDSFHTSGTVLSDGLPKSDHKL